MTTLSQYLRAEQPDLTEPAGFYLPGVDDWDNPMSEVVKQARRRMAEDEVIYFLPWIEEDE